MTSVQMAGHPLAEGGSQHPCWPAGQLPLVSVLHPVNVTAVSRLRTCEGYRVRVTSAEIPLTSPEVTTLVPPLCGRNGAPLLNREQRCGETGRETQAPSGRRKGMPTALKTQEAPQEAGKGPGTPGKGTWDFKEEGLNGVC